MQQLNRIVRCGVLLFLILIIRRRILKAYIFIVNFIKQFFSQGVPHVSMTLVVQGVPYTSGGGWLQIGTPEIPAVELNIAGSALSAALTLPTSGTASLDADRRTL
jgi:hypothetical protein